MPTDAYFDTGIFDDSQFDIYVYVPTVPTPTIYRGQDARIYLWQRLGTGDTVALSQSAIGMSDIELSLTRNIVEHSLVGEIGNLFIAGAIEFGGAITACKLDNDFAGTLLGAIVSGNYFAISGTTGRNSLSFYFISCLATSFDLSIGDSDTISEGSMDFMIADPSNIKIRNIPIHESDDNKAGMFITDVN